jgi:hypothetical protein
VPPSCFADGAEAKTGIVGHLGLLPLLREAGITGTAPRAAGTREPGALAGPQR